MHTSIGTPARFLATVIAIAIAATATPRSVSAQTGRITGTVVAEAGQRPMPGATVAVRGTTLGSLTGDDGKFSIANVPVGPHVLEVRRIGFGATTRNVTVTADQAVNVTIALSERAIALDEVVVTGTAGSTERKKLGNTLTTVDAARVAETAPLVSVDQLIQGRSAGVNMITTQGNVGSAGQIKIRGTKSVSLSGDPIMYIDGVRVNNGDDRSTSNGANAPNGGNAAFFIGGQSINRMADLNPAEIDRIEIVKGAAAATLYGTQGSNGVIQIFTKKGRAGAPQWSAEVEGGFERSPADRFPGRLWTQFVNPANGYRAHDPREIISNGAKQRYALQVNGGTDQVTYFVASSYADGEGSITPKANWNKNLATRANLGFFASPKLRIDLNSGFVFNRLRVPDNDNALHGLYSQVVAGLPYSATPDRPWGERFGSFTANQTLENKETVLRNTTGLSADWRPRDNFTNHATIGIDWFADEFTKYFPYAYQGSGNKLGSKINSDRTFRDVTVDYRSTLKNGLLSWLSSELSVGAQGDFAKTVRVTANGTNFPAPGVTTVNAAAIKLGDETRVSSVNAGVFTQETFGLWDKLFLTGGVRVDGNSAFGNEFKYQAYPKASVAYNISEESFWPTNFVPTLKLRVAYGTSGTAPQQFAADRTYQGISAQNGQPAVTPNNIGNPNLGPEKSTELEAGFDAGFFGDRVALELTYYNQKTTNALLNRNAPPSLGFLNAQATNIGAIRNRGLESSLHGQIIQRSELQWTGTLNYTTNSNKILDMGGLAPFNVNDARIVEGYPVNSIWRIPLASWDPVTRRHTAATDRVFAGSIDPKWYGSVSSDLTYRAVSLNLMMDYSGGNKKLDFSRYWDTRVRSGDHYLSLITKPTGAATAAGDSLVDFVNVIGSTAYVEPADYMALRELALTFQIPDAWASRANLKRTSLRFSGRNLYLWTKFPGVDPQVNQRGNVNVGGSSDFDSQPIPRIFLVTVRTSF
jgi:TonB-dependent starch-binding outer membrane protein SusC